MKMFSAVLCALLPFTPSLYAGTPAQEEPTEQEDPTNQEDPTQQRVPEEVLEAWGGEVSTHSVLDAKGKVESLTLRISMEAIKGVPEGLMDSVKIPLSDEVREQTLFDHVSLDWTPHGHEPLMIYGKPHFDIHFYGMTIKEVAAIDCSETTEIAENLIASGYALPDPSLVTSCVPQMGLHAAPVADFAPDFDFSETFIYGYYQNELTFFEPMITQEFFLAHQTVTRALNVPVGMGLVQTLVPHSYSVTYVEALDAYEITFSDFRGPAVPLNVIEELDR